MKQQLILSNDIRKIRTQARKFSLATLETWLQKFNQVVAERRQQEAEAQQALQEHYQKIEKYLSMLQSDGVAIQDLLQHSTELPTFKRPARKTKRKRAAKYCYVDGKGELKTWTGQGRMPKPIQVAIEQNQKQLEDFLIQR